MVFVTRPISATMLVLAVVAMVIVLLPALRKKREEAFVEHEGAASDRIAAAHRLCATR